MNQFRMVITLLGLWLVGLGVSIYQTYHFYLVRAGAHGFRSFCQFGKFDCVAVETSKYAQFIFGIPLSTFAAGWYLSMIVIALMIIGNDDEEKDFSSLGLMSGVALAFSVYYFGVMQFVLKTYCLLCMGIDLVNIGAIVVLILSNKTTKCLGWPDFSQIKKSGVASAICILLSVFGMQGAFSHSGITQDQIEQFANSFVMRERIPVEVTPDDTVVGNKDARIVVIKYSDYECPACKMAAQALVAVKSRFKNDVKFVYRNYPLSNECNSEISAKMHPHSCVAARAAFCFERSGKFEVAYNLFFEEQDKLDRDWIIEQAQKNNISKDEITQCLDSKEAMDKVSRDVEQGKKDNVKSTPTFVVNGIKMEGGYPPDIWFAILERLLAKK